MYQQLFAGRCGEPFAQKNVKRNLPKFLLLPKKPELANFFFDWVVGWPGP